MQPIKNKIYSFERAFTLVEVLAALTVGVMVLIVVMVLYNRGQSVSAAAIERMESNRMPREIFQRIAEDLDRVVGAGQGTQIDIVNKLQDGFSVAKIEIVRNITDAKDQPQTFEKIVWQSSVDSDSGLLTLYRSHSGIALEDTLLDSQKEVWQREVFVPICSGITMFRIEAQKGESRFTRWTGEVLPPAVEVTLSFAQPYKTVTGTFDVPEQDKLVRTIAVDRTRGVTFTIPVSDVNEPNDANRAADADRPTDANQPADTEESESPATLLQR